MRRGLRGTREARRTLEALVRDEARGAANLALMVRVAERLGIRPSATLADQAKLPKEGALVLLSDAPFLPEHELALSALLKPLRDDLRFVVPSILGETRQLAPLYLAESDAPDDVARSMARTRMWIRRGGAVATACRNTAAALADAGAAVICVHFPAGGDPWRRALSRIHPALGRAFEPTRLLAAGSRAGTVRVGTPVAPAALDSLPDEASRRDHLAWRARALDSRPSGASTRSVASAGAPVAARGDVAWMDEEARRVEARGALFAHERFLVVAARASEIPALLGEIGRLREVAFRAVGEGTGRALDLDAFDRTYFHLLVWDRRDRRLAGAYRLGDTTSILATSGVEGLYTSTLFEIDPELFSRMGPALELGRSFVNPDYQRSSPALLLLWKGISRFVAACRGVHTLFGAVSISAEYTDLSRRLIARVLSAHHADPELARFVTPRRGIRFSRRALRGLPDPAQVVADVTSLAALVSDVEADGKELPVLVQEYLKLGGRFLAWNVDPAFADALDGLVVVDLRRVPRRLLEFYMGRGVAADFLERHASVPPDRPAFRPRPSRGGSPFDA